MSRRWAYALVVALVAITTWMAAVMVNAGEVAARPTVLQRVEAPNARAAAYVTPAATFIRNKGFVAVKRIHSAPGQFCLKLPTSIDGRTAIAIVSPEWFESVDPHITAVWEAHSSDCGRARRWISVYTFNDFVFKDEAFSVVVP
jgi:hypothetical protein